MAKRQLANSNPKRFRALKMLKERKDVTLPADVPLTAATVLRFDLFYPVYKSKYLAVSNTLTAQGILTAQVKAAKITAGYFISDMIDALQNAIRRGTFDEAVRAQYGLPMGHALRPEIVTEQQVLDWGERVHDGETARIAAGGAPITFPSLAEVDAAVNNFKTLNLQQAAAKSAYDLAQEALDAENAECDKLILKLWNELETAFDEGNKPSMRRKCREWGVVYIPTPGEALSPEEFSIAGKVTDSTSGAAIGDVVITIVEPDVTVLTESNGNYYVAVLPAGSYTIQVHKGGYLDKTIPGVVVSEVAVTMLNMTLATAASTGTLSGTVTSPGNQPATISLPGTDQIVTTDPMGNFSIANVPAGTQTVQCWLNSDPANIKTLTPTIVAGATTTIGFSFP